MAIHPEVLNLDTAHTYKLTKFSQSHVSSVQTTEHTVIMSTDFQEHIPAGVEHTLLSMRGCL